MKIKVDHNQLDIVKENIQENSIELRNSIETIYRNIEELKLIWQGEEANTFYLKFNNYINNLRQVPNTYDNMSNFLGKANMFYNEKDLDLKKEINNVRMNN